MLDITTSVPSSESSHCVLQTISMHLFASHFYETGCCRRNPHLPKYPNFVNSCSVLEQLTGSLLMATTIIIRNRHHCPKEREMCVGFFFFKLECIIMHMVWNIKRFRTDRFGPSGVGPAIAGWVCLATFYIMSSR